MRKLPSLIGAAMILLLTTFRKASIPPTDIRTKITANSTSATSAHSSASSLRVMSWNLRVPFPIDAAVNRSWAERRDSISLAIATLLPDVLLLQEDCYFMNNDLLHAPVPGPLSDTLRIPYLSEHYKRYGRYNRNGESKPSPTWPENPFTRDGMRDGEHNSIWWNAHRLVSVGTSSFWLSDTPDVAGTSFDEVTGRIVNCVTLRGKEQVSMSPTRICSTHFPADNVTRQLLSTAVIEEDFSKYTKTHPDVQYSFIGGDFNSIPGSETYNDMLVRGFVSLHGASGHIDVVTTCDWFNSSNNAFIDYVWVYAGDASRQQQQATRLRVKRSSLVNVPCCGSDPSTSYSDLITQIDPGTTSRRIAGNRAASDHLAVLIDLDLPVCRISES